MVTREFFRRWREYRQLLRELKSYSDVELAELGLVRSACARTAFDAAFGEPIGSAALGRFMQVTRVLTSAGRWSTAPSRLA